MKFRSFSWVVSADERERMGVPKFYRWLSCAAPLAARHSPFPAHPSPPLRLLLRTSQRALPSDQPARLRGQYARHYVESEAAMAWVPARPKRLSGRGSGQPGTRPGAGRGLRRARWPSVLRPTWFLRQLASFHIWQARGRQLLPGCQRHPAQVYPRRRGRIGRREYRRLTRPHL